MVTMSGWVFGLIVFAAILIGCIGTMLTALLISGKQADAHMYQEQWGEK
jgi:hypothetical protein